VVEDILGVVKDVPVAKDGPPEDSAYQFIVPALEEVHKETVPELHLESGVVPDIEGTVFMVAVTAVLDPVVQPPLVAST
jgi:hypothetical protein